MTPALYIRTRVFGVRTQHEFATLMGVEQPTVSRWEAGNPISRKAQLRMRKLANERALKWDNNWLFDVPRDARAA